MGRAPAWGVPQCRLGCGTTTLRFNRQGKIHRTKCWGDSLLTPSNGTADPGRTAQLQDYLLPPVASCLRDPISRLASV